jgi:hypothetical protein
MSLIKKNAALFVQRGSKTYSIISNHTPFSRQKNEIDIGSNRLAIISR